MQSAILIWQFRPSVCPSHAAIVLKRLNKQSTPHLTKFQWSHPDLGAKYKCGYQKLSILINISLYFRAGTR